MSPQIQPTPQIDTPEKNKKPLQIVLTIVIALVLGFGLSRLAPLSNNSSTKSVSRDGVSEKDVISSEDLEKTGQVEVGKSYGDTDQNFKDSVQGTLEKNGLDTEGTHKLLRDGREDQTVHLVSSVLDLDIFDGRQVEVWGETNASQKAGWFMDVGLVKVLE